MTDEESKRFATLEANLKAVTDSLAVLDAIIKSERLGQPKTMAFRCAHSGLYYPQDYAKQWGITTGIGLGPDIVSECMDSMYHVAPPPIEKVKRPEDLMHPMQVSMAQLDLVVIPVEEFDAGRLVLAREDEGYTQRAAILRANQLRKPGSLIASYQAEFNRIREKGGLAQWQLR